ncbi:MAG: NAD(P)H-dependent oxidoreductase subunit E, partial [Rhodobiaceae bacterium]|nr:NAD(P)H-dependent oxidoreductase subunit E [Rhodobiaceae bacterium]
MPTIISDGRRNHPGRSRRQAPVHGKGRQVDEAARAEVETTIDGMPRDRDMLIEHLHRLQDAYGCLHARHLRGLADILKLSMAEVFEVATFYAHFDVVLEGEAPPPAVTVRVCDSLSCMLAGAETLIAALEDGTDPAAVHIVRAPCMGRCAEAPAAEVGHRAVAPATPEAVAATIAAGEFSAVMPPYTALPAYRAEGGYALLADVRSGKKSAEDMISTLSDAGLRGLGGAGFPAGRKWEIVRGFPGPRLMTVNGDEGEPGTFKDRHWLERDPHRFLEGALVAAHVVGAERVYIYMRDEYPAVLKILKAEIAALEAAGLAAPGVLEVRRGAGAYICGEESAMLESIEGK